ncbi:MAG: sugar ABC transporter ATP-binding protein [Thermoanaerobacter sp.]|nr:sugar ABC transporter ATP-binding protein [Thermoanaerobacter sp.]
MNNAERSKLKMEDISIEFPGVKALSHVNFELESGKIYGLVGANGAGKSTLMKILGGVYTHYAGKIYLDGKEINIKSPRDAKELGIEVVYQEVDTALVPYLDVAENIMLNTIVNKMDKKQFVGWNVIHEVARKTLQTLGVDINTHTLVEKLSLAQKQLILIARAIVQKTRFLILDEPTAPLSNTEIKELFRIVKDLSTNQNVGVVFISHRLPEVFEICEKITVMRDGKVVAEKDIEKVDMKQLVELMLGRKFSENYPKRKVNIGGKKLEIKNFEDTKSRIKITNLTVHRGEIVGIAGLAGAGKTEFCKSIFGVFPLRSGEIYINGKRIYNTSPSQAVKNGFALIPEERRKEGIWINESVVTNLTATSLSKFARILSIVNVSLERVCARDIIKKLSIKTPDEYQKAAYLSGGNQQKIVIGKWLIPNADIYIFDEPTKGVDIGAKHEIFEIIGQLAEMGKGIIYASCEFPEILGISDRIYVMYNGQIVKELETEKTSEEEILYYATGGK